MSVHRLLLRPVAPYRLDLTVWALRRRATNQVDRWGDNGYERTLVVNGKVIDVDVAQTGPCTAPELVARISAQRLSAGEREATAATLRRMLGIGVDLSAFYAATQADERLHRLVKRFLGVKPPQFATLFEALCNGVACQQLSLDVGIQLLNRLAQRFGTLGTGTPYRAFPTPEALSNIDPQSLRELGFNRRKCAALVAIARNAVAQPCMREALSRLDDIEAKERLCLLPGVGNWTADYVLLRGLGRTHIFPGGDVGARNNLQRFLGLQEPLDDAQARRILAPWSAYAGLIYFHLLLERLRTASPSSPIAGSGHT
ncbi:MAG: DNA-3-methyladenine glycosylase 2 family protein [Betaproteobacteria bacterium]|nr:DNA-3-methyladenine glycosylase 2 family protein [Betaproteobacteria bacterium]